jgi:hypothetical protein
MVARRRYSDKSIFLINWENKPLYRMCLQGNLEILGGFGEYFRKKLDRAFALDTIREV